MIYVFSTSHISPMFAIRPQPWCIYIPPAWLRLQESQPLGMQKCRLDKWPSLSSSNIDAAGVCILCCQPRIVQRDVENRSLLSNTGQGRKGLTLWGLEEISASLETTIHIIFHDPNPLISIQLWVPCVSWVLPPHQLDQTVNRPLSVPLTT